MCKFSNLQLPFEHEKWTYKKDGDHRQETEKTKPFREIAQEGRFDGFANRIQ